MVWRDREQCQRSLSKRLESVGDTEHAECHDRNSVKKDHRGGAFIRMDGSKTEFRKAFSGI